MRRYLIASVTALLMATGTAEAAPVTFFGEDLGLGENTRLASHPNADNARALFFSNLVGVGTETFEVIGAGAGAPLGISFAGAGTATLQGSGVTVSVPIGTNGFGRYPISGNIYWEPGNGTFSIGFSDPVAAFGFYGVDIGDFDGQITLALQSGVLTNLVVPNTVDGAGGAVLYFGVIDTANPFSLITFGNTAAGVDVFGFDDFSIGSVEQVSLSPVPEPATMLLFGSSLAALAGAAWKRRRAAQPTAD